MVPRNSVSREAIGIITHDGPKKQASLRIYVLIILIVVMVTIVPQYVPGIV